MNTINARQELTTASQNSSKKPPFLGQSQSNEELKDNEKKKE